MLAGNEVKEPCGAGLTEVAAGELGLLAGTPVGTSIIDAHSGGLGMKAVFVKFSVYSL